MTFTKEQLTRIIESADEVITALAGTNDDIHPDNSTKMCAAWDDLNDRNAPLSVVKKLAEMALAGMEAEPVAEISQAQEYDLEGNLRHQRDIDYYQDDIDKLPVRAKLYAAPQLPQQEVK